MRMPRQKAIREQTHVGVQHRIDRHCDQVTCEMHLLALRRQLSNCTDPLAHELPVGHSIRAFLLHGLRAFVTGEGNKGQSGDQDERQEYTNEQAKSRE